MTKLISVSPEDQLKELEYGCVDLIPRDIFLEKLKWSYDSQTPLKIKFGADPSRPDIHLGHAVILQKLKKFQEFGHEVIFLIGDFTAMIGDPTGKSKTRPTLSKEEVLEYSKTYQDQVAKVLDIEKLKIVFNSQWLDKLSVTDTIKIMSKTTVQTIMRRDDFSKRLKSEQPIHLHEFIYPLIQGYDSVALEADLEIGGTDQLFNLLMGRDLQNAFGQKHQQIVMTLPLLEGLDGVNKMSKSLDNYISVCDSSADIFGKLMSISDELMFKYYKLLSRKPVGIVSETVGDIKSGKLHPMEAKKRLAVEITAHYYPQNIADEERAKFEKRFSKKEVPDDLQTVKKEAGEISLVDLCTELGWIKSSSELRRLLKQGAVKVNNIQHKDLNLLIETGKSYLLKVGKLRLVQIEA